MPRPKSSLWSKSFACFNVAHFLGALNDNVFKLLLVYFLTRLNGQPSGERVIATAGAVFVLPFLLLTPACGVLADRVAKSRIIKAAKALEVVIMLAGLAAFAAQSAWGLYAVLFLMAAQSALFGPAKYGILPELVDAGDLSRANAVVAMLTYLAVIAASGLAPFISLRLAPRFDLAQLVCVGLAVAGAAAAVGVRATRPSGSSRRASLFFLRDVARTLRDIRSHRYLLAAVLGSAYFSLIGAHVQANIIPYGVRHMGFTQEQSSYLFLVAAFGIAAGSWLAGRLSGRHIEFGIVPLGAFFTMLAGVVLAAAPGNRVLVMAALVGVGLGGGLFLIPLDAFIQREAPAARRAEVVAAAGFLGWVGVLLAQGLVAGVADLGGRPAEGFLVLAALTLVLATVTFRMLPDFLLRFLVLLVTRAIYRLRVLGGENIPAAGGALLVCNHVSYIDAPLLIATQQRRLRFIMDREIYDTWRLLRPCFRLMNCIPISGEDPPRRLIAAFRAARVALDAGYLVVIFPEGRLSMTGHIREFRAGFERIVKGTACPIIPVYLGGAWGSIASYYRGRLFGRWPRLARYPVTVIFGRPLPPETPARDAQQAVSELSCDYFEDRKPRRRPLGERFVRAARAGWGRPAVADTGGRRLTGGRTLAAALVLRRSLLRLEKPGAAVGVLLPPSVTGALANLAATLAGMIPANLNFTASADALRSAVRQSGLRRVVTSRLFLQKVKVPETGAELVYVEDLLARASRTARAGAWLAARLAPARWIGGRARGFGGDSLAALLFSSGSTGEPKGVMLSHHNIQSNVESLRMVFGAGAGDRLCAALPFFHSLGFTGTLWYPLLSGLPVTYHVSPLDAAGVARAVREDRCTLLFGTPTFLALYARKVAAEDFATLRFVVAGAEKLRPDTAEAFEARFGVRPLEGYGATELSPVASLNVPDAGAGARHQAGWKEGSVGLPLPGVAMRVVDPSTGAARAAGEAGLLLVKGPNVMLGYLGRPDLTAEAVRDGWYRTGDLACIDEEGFVTITDRLSRFSKIGGEMVPHGAVEEALQRGLGRIEPLVAVAGLADPKRGERLVVLHAREAGPVERLQAILRDAPLPNLWKPASDAYVEVDVIPVLASGKLDLARIRELASRQSEASPE